MVRRVLWAVLTFVAAIGVAWIVVRHSDERAGAGAAMLAALAVFSLLGYHQGRRRPGELPALTSRPPG